MRHGRILALALAPVLALALGGLAIGAVSGSSAGKARAGTTVLFAVLDGGTEVGENGEANAGDPDGYGAATVLTRGNRVCWSMTLAGIQSPAAAHIHKGAAGTNGGVSVALDPVPQTGSPGAAGACTRARAALARDIARNPQLYYVNVHTQSYPGGAIRGQLH